MSKNIAIENYLDKCLTETNIDLSDKYVGKVRDMYFYENKSVLITTDRQSAFDRLLGAVPFKGQVLTQASVWWFEKTAHIIKNHFIASPDVNVVIAKKCKVLPIEFVVRGYISGTTSTSLWTQYNNGVRTYCGIDFPDGLQKNEKLEKNVVTPTTKEVDHDRPITPEDIVKEKWLTQEQWNFASQKALELFEFGQQESLSRGLILVDTKYEFGIEEETGDIILIDEIHTPDSSRFWIESTYKENIEKGLEPDNIDKEFFRIWFSNNCDPYADETLPTPPDDLTIELSRRYIQQFEMITGQKFIIDTNDFDINQRINKNVMSFLKV